MTNWKPGDVAMVTARWIRTDDHSERYAVKRAGGWISRASVNVADWEVSEIRPLAVIDPENPEDVERLVAAWETQLGGEFAAMQAALREFAAPTPPHCDASLSIGDGHTCAHGNSVADAIWRTT